MNNSTEQGWFQRGKNSLVLWKKPRWGGKRGGATRPGLQWSFPTLAYQLDNNKPQYAYLAGGDYYIIAYVYDAEGEVIGYTGSGGSITPKYIHVDEDYDFDTVTASVGGTSIDLNSPVTLQPGSSVVLNVKDNAYDAPYQLPREYKVTIGDFANGEFTLDTAAGNTYGANGFTFTIPINPEWPADTSYPVWIFIKATIDTGVYLQTTQSSAITIAPLVDIENNVTNDSAATVTIQQLAFDDGAPTPVNYGLSVDVTALSLTTDTYKWFIKRATDIDWVELTGETNDTLDFIDVNGNTAIGGGTGSELPPGEYKFYCEISEDGDVIGTTNTVTVTVNPLPVVPGTTVTSNNSAYDATAKTLTLVQGSFYTTGATPAVSTLTVSGVTATSPTYQWYNDLGEITGSTAATVNLIGAANAYLADDTYTYYCIIKSSGSVIGKSDDVTVEVTALTSANYTISIAGITVDGTAVTLPAALIPMTANDPIVVTVTNSATDAQAILTRVYSWEVTQGATSIDTGTAVVGTDGDGTITLDTTSSGLDLQTSTSYTLTITGTAANLGITGTPISAASTITLTIAVGP
jgi:hypothetical protein